MSIPNEKLSQLVQEIEAQAVKAQREISVVKSAIVSKQREARMLGLTAAELRTLPEGTNTYVGVGKMFVPKSRDQVTAQLSSEIEGLKSEIANLSKKLHYLETTHKNSREHISRILSSRG